MLFIPAGRYQLGRRDRSPRCLLENATRCAGRASSPSSLGGSAMGSAGVRHGRSRSWVWRRVVLPAAGVAALALVAGGCTSSGSVTSGNTPVKGGTAVMAEPPSSPPDYILPFMDAAESSNVNLFDFTYLMYRPMYWFGQGSQ